jgi:hypothetical protein
MGPFSPTSWERKVEARFLASLSRAAGEKGPAAAHFARWWEVRAGAHPQKLSGSMTSAESRVRKSSGIGAALRVCGSKKTSTVSCQAE